MPIFFHRDGARKMIIHRGAKNVSFFNFGFLILVGVWEISVKIHKIFRRK